MRIAQSIAKIRQERRVVGASLWRDPARHLTDHALCDATAASSCCCSATISTPTGLETVGFQAAAHPAHWQRHIRPPTPAIGVQFIERREPQPLRRIDRSALCRASRHGFKYDINGSLRRRTPAGGCPAHADTGGAQHADAASASLRRITATLQQDDLAAQARAAPLSVAPIAAADEPLPADDLIGWAVRRSPRCQRARRPTRTPRRRPSSWTRDLPPPDAPHRRPSRDCGGSGGEPRLDNPVRLSLYS